MKRRVVCPTILKIKALNCLTKRDGEPYDAFVERAASDPIARVVKIADYVRGWWRLQQTQ